MTCKGEKEEKGTRQRERTCQKGGGERLGLLFGPCQGSPQEYEKCKPTEKCPDGKG